MTTAPGFPSGHATTCRVKRRTADRTPISRRHPDTYAPRMTPQPDPQAGAAVKAADRAHVFHSWSAQELIDPLAVAGAEGSYFWDYDGNRYLDFTSGLVFTNIGYQHPKVVAAIQEQAGRLTTFAPALRRRGAVGGRPADRRADPGRPRQDLLHQRRRRGRRERRPHGPAAHRPPQGALRLPLVPRRHLRRDQPHRRPAPLALRQRHRRASCTSGRRSSTARPSTRRPRQQECARALQHLEDTIVFEGPPTIAAIILETIPGTAGIMIPPPGYLAGRARRSATSTGSSSSWTRSWPASDGPGSGSPPTSSTSCPT